MTTLNQGIYNAAQRLGTAIGAPSTAWTVTKTDATAGAATGFVVQGQLGSRQAPGQYDVAGPPAPFQWYFVLTSGALGVGYQVAYGGYTFSVAAAAVPTLGHYQLSLVSEP